VTNCHTLKMQAMDGKLGENCIW